MIDESITLPRLVTAGVAAEYLGVHVVTLATWRQKGEGPRYTKLGPHLVRYAVPDLAEWVRSHQHESTAETRASA